MYTLKKAVGGAILFIGIWFFYDKFYIIQALLDHKIGVQPSKLFIPTVLIIAGAYLLLSKEARKTSKADKK